MAYIPEVHKKYGLLPEFVERRIEIIIYPTPDDLDVVEMLPDGESFSQEGFRDYAQYYASLDDLMSRLGVTDGELNDLGKKLSEFKEAVQKINIKENWAVLRYVGESNQSICEFTHGRYYYAAYSIRPFRFYGIIDDEGLPVYRGSSIFDYKRPFIKIDSSDWEIAEDPYGKAVQLIKKKA